MRPISELELPQVFLSGIAYDLTVVDPDLNTTDHGQLTFRESMMSFTHRQSATGWFFRGSVDEGLSVGLRWRCAASPFMSQVPIIPASSVSALPPPVAIGTALLIRRAARPDAWVVAGRMGA